MGILPCSLKTARTSNPSASPAKKSTTSPASKPCSIRKFANGRLLHIHAKAHGRPRKEFTAKVRIDTPQEIEYYEHGGILQYVLRQLASK